MFWGFLSSAVRKHTLGYDLRETSSAPTHLEAINKGRLFKYFLLGLLLLAQGFFNARASGDQKLLRSPKTECGIYLTHIANGNKQKEDSKGRQIVASLDPESFEKFLESQPKGLEIPEDAKIAIVGAPWKKSERRELENQLKAVLKSKGFGDVPVQSIRKLTSWSESVQGVFQNVDGKWVKKTGASPWEIRRGLEQKLIEDGLPTMIVGAPVIGPDSTRFDDFLSKILGHYDFKTWSDGRFKTDIKRQSVVGAMVAKAFREPWEFFSYLGKRARSVFIMSEDYQVPTPEEKSKALEKLIVPGTLTTITLTIQSFFGGKPLSVVLPTTIINGINSYGTGRWRNTIQNWTRRSLSAFPDQFLKDLGLSIFFTADIYFLGDPSRWSQTLDSSAWQTFFATKWLSILFNSSWRTPNGMVVASWERYAMEELHRTPTAVRHAGSAISKYTSYLMTQFFIYSILTRDVLFRVASLPEAGIGIFPDGHLPAGATELMGFNVGHAAMAACGVLSACISFFRGPQTAIADIAVRLDQKETQFLDWIFRRKKSGTPDQKSDNSTR